MVGENKMRTVAKTAMDVFLPELPLLAMLLAALWFVNTILK
jgi:hypothetical protein